MKIRQMKTAGCFKTLASKNGLHKNPWNEITHSPLVHTILYPYGQNLRQSQ